MERYSSRERDSSEHSPALSQALETRSPAAEHGLLQRRAGAAPTLAAPSCCYLPAPVRPPCPSGRTQGAVPPEGVPAPGGRAGLPEVADLLQQILCARPAGWLRGWDHPLPRAPRDAAVLTARPAPQGPDAPAVLT